MILRVDSFVLAPPNVERYSVCKNWHYIFGKRNKYIYIYIYIYIHTHTHNTYTQYNTMGFLLGVIFRALQNDISEAIQL